MQDIIKRLKQFNTEREWDQFHTPENIAKSIAIEAGELLECFQWNNNFNIDKVKDELADILLYASIMAYKLDLDITQIMDDKITRNEERYSVSNAKGNSKKYTEFKNENNTEDI